MLRRFAVATVFVLVGCGGPRSGASKPIPSERNRLTREEILSSNARQGDLYEAIRSLRPQFFMAAPSVHSVGSTASMPLVVYFGRLRQSGIEVLRSVSAINVDEVRYLDPTASQNEFGPMASGGALIVVLRDPDKHPDTTVSTRGVARATQR